MALRKRLTEEDEDQLREWLGKPDAGFELLFKASTQGYNSATFHQLCNNKGPTVTVAYNAIGWVFGGYASEPWTSRGSYVQAPDSFLFRLSNANKFDPLKIPANQYVQNCLYDLQDRGPVFGGGHDFQVFTGTYQANNGNFINANGSSNIGYTYGNGMGHNVNTFCGGNLSYLDVEVYSIGKREEKEVPIEKKMLQEGKEWRKVQWSDEERERLKQQVAGYKPQVCSSVSQVNVLLVGQVGSGKSSFFNTINSIYKGRVSSQAMAGSQPHSLTTRYRTYEVRGERHGETLCFRLCDTMGLEDANTGLDLDDLPYLLDGNVPDRYQFNAAVNISPATPGFKNMAGMKDRTHCVALAMDICNISVMPQGAMDKIKTIYNKALKRGIPSVVLLTKVDKACEFVAEDLSTVYRSRFILEKVKEVSEKLGLPEYHIFPVQNYSKQTSLDTQIDILALSALTQILGFADDYLDEHYEALATENLQKLNVKE
ncbi:PREDICTED: interferon-induced protein 44-like [Branchiostoma belcheri]|uniref:Interferon-induced protein 44-like n=1 Tax=Branchiostoma belcheri TaxID=7741 RepID=A0A6P4ZNH9_BRABE|nr:PREDICTED: interferon-induced protein 44-like [Branchiostoma belcheri]